MRFPRRFRSDPVTCGTATARSSTWCSAGGRVLEPPTRRVAVARWLRSSGRDATSSEVLPLNLSHRRSAACPWLRSNGTGQRARSLHGAAWLVSRVSELSFLSFNRPRRRSSATQLSSTRRQPNGVCAEMQRGGRTVMPPGASAWATFIGRSDSRATAEPGKSGMRAATPCHPRFLTAGHRPELSKVD
jgi:hypothetical protein